MKRDFTLIYVRSDMYALYYNEKDGEIYKIPFKEKTSASNIYMAIIMILIIERSLSPLYDMYRNLILDILLIVVGIFIANRVVKSLYKTFYEMENIRLMNWLESTYLKRCLEEGLKQSRRESVILITFLLVTIVTFIVFFIAKSFTALVLGILSTTTFIVLKDMRPIRRKEATKKIYAKYIN